MEKTGDAAKRRKNFFAPPTPDVHGGYFAPTAERGEREGCSIRLSAEKGERARGGEGEGE